MGAGLHPRESRTTRRSSLQYHHERGAGAPVETPWRAMLRRRPFFPRASAALSGGWGRGCAPRESDDTEVVPPVSPRARRGSARRNPLEGDAPSAPIFPARQRGIVRRMGAGLRPARVGRHGGRPSSFITSAARERPSKLWRAMLRRRPFFPRASAALSAGWGRGCAPRESDDTEVVPPVSSRARRGSAPRNSGGRCSVGAHFSRAPARLCRPDGGGAAPRESRTTRRSSLQYHHERGAGAPVETLEGDAPSAPTFPARQRGIVRPPIFIFCRS